MTPPLDALRHGLLAPVRTVSATPPVQLNLADVLDGEVVRIAGALRQTGMFDDLKRLILDAVEACASPHARAAVAADGVERLHDHLDVHQVLLLRKRLATGLADHSFALTALLVNALRTQPRPVYVCGRVYVRIMMPEDVVAQYRAMLVREAGFMTPHGPHLDSWFSQGRNAVNLWMAIGRVSPGNGLLFYPKRYGEGLRRVGEAGDPAQYVGRPGGVCLEPADTLVFHGDHLHATEVNITDETRFVLTTRISLGPPRYRHRGTGWVPYYDLRLLGTPLRRFASLRSRLTISAARQAIGAARRAIRFRPGTAAR